MQGTAFDLSRLAMILVASDWLLQPYTRLQMAAVPSRLWCSTIHSRVYDVGKLQPSCAGFIKWTTLSLNLQFILQPKHFSKVLKESALEPLLYSTPHIL